MSPCTLINKWLQLAIEHKVPKARAFCLSTISESGFPTSRMLLAMSADSRGIVFCTDSRSPKTAEFSANGKASALMYWHPISRQIRIEGEIIVADDVIADADFESKTREQKMLIRLCRQSEVTERHWHLERAFKREIDLGTCETLIKRPDHWKAYRLCVQRAEFFLGGSHRLNRRSLFVQQPDGKWKVNALAP
jgi:pyridoxamine 5'-phosphate oxidase